jgi:hypothetical protein
MIKKDNNIINEKCRNCINNKICQTKETFGCEGLDYVEEIIIKEEEEDDDNESLSPETIKAFDDKLSSNEAIKEIKKINNERAGLEEYYEYRKIELDIKERIEKEEFMKVK